MACCINIYAQKQLGTCITFNNNRFCIGVSLQSKKGFGILISGGLLGKDEFSRTRANLFGRIFPKHRMYEFPFNDYNMPCGNLNPDGYKLVLYGTKIQFQYSIKNKVHYNKFNFYDVGVFLGVFISKGYWTPTKVYNYNPNIDTLNCLNKKIATSVGGLYGGLYANYYFAIPKYHQLYIGVGVQIPFYRPFYPYSYAFDIGTSPLLSGVEPELKLSLIKKL